MKKELESKRDKEITAEFLLENKEMSDICYRQSPFDFARIALRWECLCAFFWERCLSIFLECNYFDNVHSNTSVIQSQLYPRICDMSIIVDEIKKTSMIHENSLLKEENDHSFIDEIIFVIRTKCSKHNQLKKWTKLALKI